MKIEVRNVHFAKSFHFYLISALIKDHISNIFYEYLWLSHNFNIIVINTRLLHIFMHSDSERILFNETAIPAAIRQVFSSYFLQSFWLCRQMIDGKHISKMMEFADDTHLTLFT